ncbi:MAG: malonic semialdehyde reductase [Alphaproteobacteria bacterium]
MTDDKAATEAAFRALKARVQKLDDDGMDLLFREGRTCYGWLDRKVPAELLKRIVDLALLPPTSANSSPARFVFVVSEDAKAKLKPCLSSGNVDKTMAAPATAIVGYDPMFWHHMDRLFPHGDMKSMFEKSQAMADEASFRNGSLMGAYTILAARALGLDCGPMSGFNPKAIDEAFFAGTTYKANFLCNIGYGDPATVKPRGPKFAFEEIASIV